MITPAPAKPQKTAPTGMPLSQSPSQTPPAQTKPAQPPKTSSGGQKTRPPSSGTGLNMKKVEKALELALTAAARMVGTGPEAVEDKLEFLEDAVKSLKDIVHGEKKREEE